jgi:hypothetical protein
MPRFATRLHLIALVGALCAMQACSNPAGDAETTPGATLAVVPTGVIAQPTSVAAATPVAAITANTSTQPTSVLGPTTGPQPACTNDMEFVADVTIPDDMAIAPGTSFDKLWMVKNSGTCAWDGSYHLVQLTSSAVQAVFKDLPVPPARPGASIEIGLKMTLAAEAQPGSKQVAMFELRDPTGKRFGTKLTIQVVAALPGTEPGIEPGTIGGTVWLDYCHVGNKGTGSATPDPGHCVITADGITQADGVFQKGEKGIAGVKVELHSETCSGPIVGSARTDSRGVYAFTGLIAGAYCVAINVLDADNSSILIPGSWTSPVATDAPATREVTLGAGSMTAQRLNFGWDYQLD